MMDSERDLEEVWLAAAFLEQAYTLLDPGPAGSTKTLDILDRPGFGFIPSKKQRKNVHPMEKRRGPQV